MMKFALTLEGPAAIRYPRGTAYDGLEDNRTPVRIGKSEILFSGEKAAILAVGSCVEQAVEARRILEAEGISPTLVNVRFVKPLDEAMIEVLSKTHTHLITVEDNVKAGGYGEHVAAVLKEKNLPLHLKILGVPDRFISQGSVAIQKKACGIDGEAIAEAVRAAFKE